MRSRVQGKRRELEANSSHMPFVGNREVCSQWVFGLRCPLVAISFPEVDSGDIPESQDAKMDRGVLWVEISILSLKMLDMECQIWENTSKLFQKPRFTHLLTDQPWFALPTETCSCLHVSTLFSIYKDIQLGFSFIVKTLGNKPLWLYILGNADTTDEFL